MKIVLCILTCFVGLDAAYIQNVDLTTLASPMGFTISGAVNGDQSGFSVKAVGDVSGDGIQDVIMGARSANPVVGGVGRLNAGMSYVVFGQYSGTGSYPNVDLTQFATAGNVFGFAVLGAAADDNNGQSVSGAGDVNGDGIDDMIVGSPGADLSSPVRTNCGVTYVIFGRNLLEGPSSYANIDLLTLTNSGGSPLGFLILGAADNDNSGSFVSNAGDVNGDGLADIITSAYLGDPVVNMATRTDAGMTYVVFGRSYTSGASAYATVDLSIIATSGNTLGYAVLGATAGDQSGNAVSAAGDVNGDGAADTIVGAWSADAVVNTVSRADAGISYVLFGRKKSLGLAASFANIDLANFATTGTTQGFAIWGGSAGDNSGNSVRTAGDINKDGVADIIVGAVNADPVLNGVVTSAAGMSYVIFGRANTGDGSYYTNVDLLPLSTAGSTLGFAILGGAAMDMSGNSVSNAGDVNGDGVDDVIVGAYGADRYINGVLTDSVGISYVVFGRAASRGAASYTNVYLGSFGTVPSLGFQIVGVNGGDSSGFCVSVAGDVNADGLPDVIVGAYPAGGSGRSYVVFGVFSAPSSQPSSQPSQQPSSQPTRQPTAQPFSNPTSQPSARPSMRPSAQPFSCPSGQPSSQPSRRPSAQPSTQPSRRPSAQPTSRPSGQPSVQPSAQPSSMPVALPTSRPSSQPSSRPSGQPVGMPSARPSSQPIARPSALPSAQPSTYPSSQPSVLPTTRPTSRPSPRPSAQPSGQPSTQPTVVPSMDPTSTPSSEPSEQPTSQPTVQPSAQPSKQPSARPSLQPAATPTVIPSGRPSGQPSSAPSAQPSVQPSAVPSTLPSGRPSAVPSAQPVAAPSAAPSSEPSGRPTTQPSSQPSAVPSAQLTVEPSVQPTSQPSEQPSAQPAARPTSQPSAQPSSVPSAQPSQQPRAAPSGQPTAAPSAHPTLAPTGEWATVVSQTSQLTKVSYPDGHVWACEKTASSSSPLCVLADAATGVLTVQYQFAWTSVTSVFATNAVNSVVISGCITSSAGTIMTNEVATCTTADQSQLHCTATSFHDTTFLAASFVPYPNTIVFVGWYNVHTCIALLDVASNSVMSYLYTASNMKTLTLSQVQSPPAFVGSFVAGTAVRATASAVNCIVAGMIRTDGGTLKGMALMPQSSDILNSADLVNVMALEYTGPDSFVAGSLQLTDVHDKHAYLLRANALYNTISYCVRYRSLLGGRRALSAGGAAVVSRSVVRGMVLVDTTLFMIVDHTSNSNVTSLTVLKTSVSDGVIIKQVHVTAPNDTSLNCTGISISVSYLNIVCTYGNSSLLLSVNQALSFSVLPVGFVRSEEAIFSAETIPFQRTVLTITQTNAVAVTSPYGFDVTDQGPTLKPSLAPSYKPFSQPSSAPSGQPSSSPTAAPSVSARPTSQPSTSGPTSTRRPTVQPTVTPTRMPSIATTARPSLRPTVSPSAVSTVAASRAPTAAPTARPSAMPSTAPMSRPSARPTTAPTTRPSSAGTSTPTVVSIQTSTNSENNSLVSPYVVGASVGGGLVLLIIGYAVYRYYQHDQDKKAHEQRMTIIAEEDRVATVNYIQEKAERDAARRVQKEFDDAERARRRAEKRRATRARSTGGRGRVGGVAVGRGAYAVGPTAPQSKHAEQSRALAPVRANTAVSSDSSDYAASSLRSDEISSARESRSQYSGDSIFSGDSRDSVNIYYSVERPRSRSRSGSSYSYSGSEESGQDGGNSEEGSDVDYVQRRGSELQNTKFANFAETMVRELHSSSSSDYDYDSNSSHDSAFSYV